MDERVVAEVEWEHDTTPDDRAGYYMTEFVRVMVESGLDRNEPTDDGQSHLFTPTCSEQLRMAVGWFGDGQPTE